MESVHPGKASRPTRTPVNAVEESRRRDNGAVLGRLRVGAVPVERVGVADTLAEVPYGATRRLFVEQTHAVLPWAVIGPKPAA